MEAPGVPVRAIPDLPRRGARVDRGAVLRPAVEIRHWRACSGVSSAGGRRSAPGSSGQRGARQARGRRARGMGPVAPSGARRGNCDSRSTAVAFTQRGHHARADPRGLRVAAPVPTRTSAPRRFGARLLLATDIAQDLDRMDRRSTSVAHRSPQRPPVPGGFTRRFVGVERHDLPSRPPTMGPSSHTSAQLGRHRCPGAPARRSCQDDTVVHRARSRRRGRDDDGDASSPHSVRVRRLRLGPTSWQRTIARGSDDPERLVTVDGRPRGPHLMCRPVDIGADTPPGLLRVAVL